MTPDEIVNDGKAKSTDHTMHTMLAVNSEMFPLSVSTYNLDIPGGQKVHLRPHNIYIHLAWDTIYHDVMLRHEKIYHDFQNGAITNLSNLHELTPFKRPIYVASIFALLYDVFDKGESRGRL